MSDSVFKQLLLISDSINHLNSMMYILLIGLALVGTYKLIYKLLMRFA